MNFDLILSQEAVQDVMQLTVASKSKTAVVQALRQIQQALIVEIINVKRI